jgi:hypothetical protein
MISNTRSPPGRVQGCAQEPPEQPNYCMNPLVQYAPPAQTPDSSQGNAESQEPTGYPDAAPFSQANEKTGARFSPRNRLNDPIFLVLFIVSVVGFAVVSGLAINTFIQLNDWEGDLVARVAVRRGTTSPSISKCCHPHEAKVPVKTRRVT